MPETMYVKPTRDGVLLRNPATGEIIPPEGAAVTLGPYRVFWLRRIKDGDALAVATKEATDEDSNELHKTPLIEITVAIRNTAEL